MNRMKLIFALIALASAVAISPSIFTVKNAEAAAYSGAAGASNNGNDFLLFSCYIIRTYQLYLFNKLV